MFNGGDEDQSKYWDDVNDNDEYIKENYKLKQNKFQKKNKYQIINLQKFLIIQLNL